MSDPPTGTNFELTRSIARGGSKTRPTVKARCCRRVSRWRSIAIVHSRSRRIAEDGTSLIASGEARSDRCPLRPRATPKAPRLNTPPMGHVLERRRIRDHGHISKRAGRLTGRRHHRGLVVSVDGAVDDHGLVAGLADLRSPDLLDPGVEVATVNELDACDGGLGARLRREIGQGDDYAGASGQVFSPCRRTGEQWGEPVDLLSLHRGRARSEALPLQWPPLTPWSTRPRRTIGFRPSDTGPAVEPSREPH